MAHAQRPYLVLNVALQTAGEPRTLAPAVREVLHELDAQKPAHGIHALADLLGATYARDRQTMLVMAGFAVAALLLAVFGVHGVLLHRVRERTREIGIRMAIGASRGHGSSPGWPATACVSSCSGSGSGLALAALSARAVSSLALRDRLHSTARACSAVAALPADRAPRVAPPGLAGHAHRRGGSPAARVAGRTIRRPRRPGGRPPGRAGPSSGRTRGWQPAPSEELPSSCASRSGR